MSTDYVKAINGLSASVEQAAQDFYESCEECGFASVIEGLANALEDMEIDEKEWLNCGPSWCGICGKFYEHTIDEWGNWWPVMNCRLDVGCWYCSSHSEDEIQLYKKTVV